MGWRCPQAACSLLHPKFAAGFHDPVTVAKNVMEGHFECGIRVPRDGGIRAGGARHLCLVTHFAANGWPCAKFHSQLAAHYPRNCEKPTKGINWRFTSRIADVKFHKENESLCHKEIRNSWYNTALNGRSTRAARLEILPSRSWPDYGFIWAYLDVYDPSGINESQTASSKFSFKKVRRKKKKKKDIYIFTGGEGCKRERERKLLDVYPTLHLTSQYGSPGYRILIPGLRQYRPATVFPRSFFVV